MKFAIVILTYNQIEQTVDCIKSIQAVKAREFPDKQIFVVHNGSDPAVVADLRNRYPRFHHVVLNENESFAAGANAGIRAAFTLQPWVLFLTQDTTLVHFPKGPPFEPCLAAVKVYKRKVEVVNSMGGAVDLDLAKHYYCTKADHFWNSFENAVLQPYVPRTAFWIHQQPFEKVNGFDEGLGSIWEDVDLSIRLREDGEMLQLDETTEVIHHRKGFSRRDPVTIRFLYNRNRFWVSRRKLRNRGQSIMFELGIFNEWFWLWLGTFLKKPSDGRLVWKAYRASFERPLTPPHLALAPPAKAAVEDEAEVDAEKANAKGDAKAEAKTKTKNEKKSAPKAKSKSISVEPAAGDTKTTGPTGLTSTEKDELDTKSGTRTGTSSE